MKRTAVSLALAGLLAACDGGAERVEQGAVSEVARADERGARTEDGVRAAARTGEPVLEPTAPSTLAPESSSPEDLRAELARARARVRALELELARMREERVAREREWLEYTQSIARLATIADLQSARFQPATDANGTIVPATGERQEPPPLAPRDPERERVARERDVAIRTSLRALLLAEQVSGLELLESGRLQDGAVGPVVLRMSDDLGRTIGTLCAERLHLEASIAARSVTLVLDAGYERRGGERLPFPPAPDEAASIPVDDAKDAAAAPAEDGAKAPTSGSTEAPANDAAPANVDPPVAPALRSGRRRIELPHVDPRPWIEAVPELFRPADREAPPDDGRWDLLSVRAGLNLLLRADAAGGSWRLAGLAGVQEGVLRDVQLEELDREGRLEKKLFADRLVLRADDEGVRLELESGAVLRGDSKAPFLDGRYRIFLPGASVADWRAAGLPGLSAPPARRER